MRKFNVLAAVSAALLTTGGVSAKAKSSEPKPRKICRTEQMPGRITPQRICRIVPPADSSAQDDPRKTGEGREAKDVRD